MGFVYALGSGLPVFIMGIAFLRNRINFIKKGNRTVATVVKIEERLDGDNDPYYVPFFAFTIYNNKETIYEHRSTQWKERWRLGEQVTIVYKEVFLNKYEVILLTFSNAFFFSTAFITVGFALLVGAGIIYWQPAGLTIAWIIPISIILPVLGIYFWSIRFFKQLD